MASFAAKMVAGRRILKGETTKEEVAKEMKVSPNTVGSWVRAVKLAAVQEHTGGEYKIPKPKPQKKKPVLEDPAPKAETPTKPTAAAPSVPQPAKKKEEEEWDII